MAVNAAIVNAQNVCLLLTIKIVMMYIPMTTALTVLETHTVKYDQVVIMQIKYPIMCRAVFIFTVIVANWISIYLVLECIEHHKVQQGLKKSDTYRPHYPHSPV